MLRFYTIIRHYSLTIAILGVIYGLAVNEQLGKILEIADFVKFAKVKPLPDDNEVAYQRAVTFVEETKPVEAPVEETENDDKSKNAAEEPPVEQKGGKK